MLYVYDLEMSIVKVHTNTFAVHIYTCILYIANCRSPVLIYICVCVCVVRVDCMCVQGLNGDMGMKGMKGDPGMDGQMGVQVSDTMLGLLTTLLRSHFNQLQNRCACTYVRVQ